MTQSESLTLITCAAQEMGETLIGSKASTKDQGAGMLMDDLLPTASRTGDVAVCVGGGNDPLSEYDAALVLCEEAKLSVVNFACNDMIAMFPHHLDHAVTLHPDKMYGWIELRRKFGHPLPVGRTWAHRPYKDFSDHTRDWQGSSGLFMAKIARVVGFTKIILCGVPMQTEADHFVRHQRWTACQGFIRGWQRNIRTIAAQTRSMSGWTQEQLGAPTVEWLLTPDSTPPLAAEPNRLKA